MKAQSQSICYCRGSATCAVDEATSEIILNPASRVAFRRKAFNPINRAIRKRHADIKAAADFPFLNFKDHFRLALALRFKRIEHIDNIDHFPKAICHASGHCRADFQCLVQPDEIVIHRVQRDRARVVFDLLCRTRLSAE